MMNNLIFSCSILLLCALHCSAWTWEYFADQQIRIIRELPVRQNLSRTMKSLFNEEAVKKFLSNSDNLTVLMSEYNISSGCQQSVSYALKSGGSWTENMLDAMAKPPPSIKMGALNWLGGFKQCMDNPPPKPYDGPGKPPRSHYCNVNIESPYIKSPITVSPQLKLGLCLPEQCTTADINIMFTALFARINQTTGDYDASLVPYLTYCYIRSEEMTFNIGVYIMLFFCALTGVAIVVGTSYDAFVIRRRKIVSYGIPMEQVQATEGSVDAAETSNMDGTVGDIQLEENGGGVSENANKGNVEVEETEGLPELKLWEDMFLSFSVVSNTEKIMDASLPPSRLGCLDGIRFLSMSWVILGHTYYLAGGYSNNVASYAKEVLSDWRFMAITGGSFSVDSFFVLSGFLTTYMFMKAARKMGTLRNRRFWLLYFFHRYWRLTPPYMLFLGLSTTMFMYISNGPFWNQVTPLEGFNCLSTWWLNLFYVNNFIHQKFMCMGWSWYLANDMQFYVVVAPILLTLMFFFGKWGFFSGVPVIVLSIVSVGVISSVNKIVGVEDLGTLDPDSVAFNSIFTKPWCRVHTYVMGMMTAYLLLEQKKRNWKLHPVLLVIGWIVAAIAMLATIYGPAGVANGSYKMTLVTSALYYSLTRFAWALGLCWIIYTCLTGYGGYLNQFLSWRAFIPLGRLSYAAYLVHIMVQYTCFGSLQSPLILNGPLMVFLFFAFMVASYGAAFILAITWESPFIRMERAIMKKRN